MKNTICPTLGHLLRELIKAGGYRGCLINQGLDKDLDDLAVDAKTRQSKIFDLMTGIETVFFSALEADCGVEWSQFLKKSWIRTRGTFQLLAQKVDFSPMPKGEGIQSFNQKFSVPMLSRFVSLTGREFRNINVATFLLSPFKSWLDLASYQTGQTQNKILDNLTLAVNADPRTVERWLAGESIGKISWPYKPIVTLAIGNSVSDENIRLLSGWLIFTCAIQSLTIDTRLKILSYLTSKESDSWTLESAIHQLNQDAFRFGDLPIRKKALPLLDEIQLLFSTKPRNDTALKNRLTQFETLIEKSQPFIQPSYRYILDWFSARHSALCEDKKSALLHYSNAISGAWWFAGPNQHQVLSEGLLHAVGVGEKDLANAYWDKTFVLGLNRAPKRSLDEQEMRRLSFAFEKQFYPQKAKARIPSPLRISEKIDFSIDRGYLKSPNQKIKLSEGRIRKTPLMIAIQEGTLDHVKQLVDAGADLNGYIPESGEGPLTYAMRRACDRKDTNVMDYLLTFNLTIETVNRPASTQRETPLKIAIEMANANAVTRLIELGADPEAPCDYVPSALCYAMLLLHGSIHRTDDTQHINYFKGKIPADAYDAKDGAVFTNDLVQRRKRIWELANSSDRNRQIQKAVFDYFIRSPDDHREAIKALLNGRANANRRYKVEANHLSEWTPTLFAAQVGDLNVFKMLIEHKGDPNLTLMPPNGLEHFDALWVAVGHGRHAIVSYLLEHNRSLFR
nr:ankyrin repeat domain-containing protein [uncultured Undibacterium sp.]